MRLVGLGLVSLVVSSCASMHLGSAQDASSSCPKNYGHTRSAKSCNGEAREESASARKEPSDAKLSKSAAASSALLSSSFELPGATASEALRSPGLRKPASPNWVCEVEAASKVFTGVGASRDEALSSARTNCGSHFQASYCAKADCKQNM